MCCKSICLSSQHQLIMLAASLFLICNLFIHLMSPSTTYEIIPDQTVFNLSGRQRMLMMRLTRTLSEIQASFSSIRVNSVEEQGVAPK